MNKILLTEHSVTKTSGIVNHFFFSISIGKGVLFKTFDVKVQVQNVPEL